MNDKNIYKKINKMQSLVKQRVYTDSRSIQEDSTIIQTHLATLNPPTKAQSQGIHNIS